MQAVEYGLTYLEGPGACLVDLIGKHHARVAHERGDVGRLATRRCSDVDHSHALCGRERHDWQERSRALQHVVASHVLWGGSHWNLGVVHHKANLRDEVSVCVWDEVSGCVCQYV